MAPNPPYVSTTIDSDCVMDIRIEGDSCQPCNKRRVNNTNRYPFLRGGIRIRYFTDAGWNIRIAAGVKFPVGVELWRHIVLAKPSPAMYLSINLRVLPSRQISDGDGNAVGVPLRATWDTDSFMER